MPPSPPAQAFRADWVWLEPGRLEENLTVVLQAGRIREITARPPQGVPCQDLGPGLITPGLINAHSHLELSGLSELEPAGDFVAWLEQLVAARPAQEPQKAAAATLAAAEQAADSGTALVADVTNTGRARPAVAAAGLHAVFFFEALGPKGFEPPPPQRAWPDGRLEITARAAHSPYAVPGQRIQTLKAGAGGGPFCIHLAESRAEFEFLAGQGPQGQRLADFLRARGMRQGELNLTAPRGLEHLINLGVVDRHTLLVHGVQLEGDEVAKLAATRSSLCLCPRSNLGLTGGLAPVQRLLEAGVNLALGTDSLASAPDMNLWADMAALAQARPGLDPEAVLAMATLGGARALGLERHLGRLRPGALGPLAFMPLERLPRSQVLEAALKPQAAARARSVGRSVGQEGEQA